MDAHTDPRPVHLRDYTPPAYLIDDVALTFDLDTANTRVVSKLAVRRNEHTPPDAPLVLDGEDVELVRLALDGVALGAGRYRRDGRTLTIDGVPEQFTLEVETRIAPDKNTELSGLYVSGGSFFTQCEAQGFRRITYFPDRPDVMARYDVTLTADRVHAAALLSNGNPAGRGERDGRVWARWVDPHPKPSYLFALVAGDLVSVDDRFTTRSGRDVALHIWVRRGDEDRCEHAMRSLKKSMTWDEEVFGLEYDLDVFNIAAVSDFNMGAMENKGLNVFNTKYVLAKPESATDNDYMGIETVIAHEYFHNWTGNRITCRDWFQLSLKEGLTVFRDQEFSADQGSRAVKRIADVRGLRASQFPEDAGPLAHPVRPQSYISIDNFYTATVYQKGAEVVRMIQTIIGRENFRKGMDLYVARHDNQAVTIEDFVSAMQDASGIDLGAFAAWYSQAGTPEITVSDRYDADARRYTLTLSQDCKATPHQPPKHPLTIPVAAGLLDANGQEVATRTLMLSQARQDFVFDDVHSRPTPSLLRQFSAPVKLHGLDDTKLEFLALHDTDPFVRWDSLQSYAARLILGMVAARDARNAWSPDTRLIEIFAGILQRADEDPAYAALALGLPSQGFLGDQMAIDDVDGIADARRFVGRSIASALASALRETYERLGNRGDDRAIDGTTMGRRSLKNMCLAYLVKADAGWASEAASSQFAKSGNMTDTLAALATLCELGGAPRDAALAEFHSRWKGDELVLDKWFAIQAGANVPNALDDALHLATHADFEIGNPNRVRALVGTLAGNRIAFHKADGRGYKFLADTIAALDPRNSQLAARMVPPLGKWRRFDTHRQALMKSELERILAMPELSRGTYEMVKRSLG